MKKKSFVLLFFLACVFCFSQAPVDLFDPFYDDVNIWSMTGLINDAPAVRPYPLQEIRRILNIVLENGSENQKRRAEEYRNRFFGKVFHFGGLSGFDFIVPSKEKNFGLSPFAELNFSLNEILTGSAHINFSLLNRKPKDEVLPQFQFSKKDIVSDNSKVGSFTLLPMFNSSVAVGTPQYYFSAGIARTSFGPFAENNIIVGEQGVHAGQFIFVVNKERFTYNQILLAIAATNDIKNGIAPRKFLYGHSIDIRIFPWLYIGFLDLMVSGGRFDPLYLIPLSAFFIGQGIYDFPDNSMLGVSFCIKPLKGLKLDCVLLADDLGFNEIIKFKSARWRMAGQFGISYALPKDSWFTFVDLNYTLITPYCYSHYDSYDAKISNYQNYTHHGEPLGSNLPPNSDRINLKLKFRPIYGFDLNFFNTFIRHANINESLDDVGVLKDYFVKQYTTDGSVFNHPTTVFKDSIGEAQSDKHALLQSTPFLRQQTVQYVNQLGVECVFHFPILKTGGNMLFKIGYVFEANINKGVNENLYNKSEDAYFQSLLNIRADSLTDEQKGKIESERIRQLNKWRKNAIGKEFNHFFNISVKVAY